MNGKKISEYHIVSTSHETLFSGPEWHLWRFMIKCSLSFLVCIFLVGLVCCAVIPTPEHNLLEGRGEIDESDIAFLTVNKTTREEVLLRFGEPDLVLNDQLILIYHWSVSHGYWLLPSPTSEAAQHGYPPYGMGTIPKDYLFMLEFDGECRLKRFEIGGSIWTSPLNRIYEWTHPSSE